MSRKALIHHLYPSDEMRDAFRPYVLTARRLLRRELRLSDLGYARQISYSQFGEDLWLAAYFADQPTGFYIDVGAYDPFNASNTLLLYRRGWSGINLEPDPAALARLQRFRPRDVNLGLAISEQPGNATFILAGSFSGIDSPDHRWPDTSSERISVPTRRLVDVLAEHRPSGEIDLLDVDCEGHDLAVLRSNDWERFRPRVILAESHEGSPDDTNQFLGQVGYRIVERMELTFAFERAD